MSPKAKVLIYLLRRDLRLADNPVLHEISRINQQSQKAFTHVLPVYTFSANQVEVSGFTTEGSKSPYKEARSAVGGFWRCGRLRAKFVAESVWELKTDLEKAGSGLEIRVGTVNDVVESLLEGYRNRDDAEVQALWMTSEEGWEEKAEEESARSLTEESGAQFKLWPDEKYFIDDRDLPFQDPTQLSDVFTNFRKTVEPLRAGPRKQLPKPDSLPSLPEHIPPQAAPFEIPTALDGLIRALWKPLPENLAVPQAPKWPEGAKSAFPFEGGSQAAHERVQHLLDSGAMTAYKDTRNGLLGEDFSTKLSAWLALGSVSSRQIHWYMMDFEDGKGNFGKDAPGYGQGENKGTSGVRFELLWRDYMRLCTKKFGTSLFFVGGYRGDKDAKFKFISSPVTRSTEKKNVKGSNDADTKEAVERFINGRTGIGLIDASNRELFLTGYTSNRARQNVASFLAKHLGIDWRIGAEWYETNLVDYDLSSNWGNWQYVAGVGNDPRGDARVFNPVKQALDYDPQGEYIKMWVPELRDVGKKEKGAENLMGIYQAWRLPEEEKARLNLKGVQWVEHPLKRIEFSMNRRGGGSKRGGRGGRSRGRGGRGRSSSDRSRGGRE
ncbi:cryptochrome [Polychaeton citri CBS 116435]|uniref:Cryptochrome DASH n=1 Tax=Polychaeton citri CBS 116435 TaxID=1314669 RepID=A0A9P4Q7U3_9PEZI|nr:cryptochrome [Polychaeton citri CBS 116435]